MANWISSKLKVAETFLQQASNSLSPLISLSLYFSLKFVTICAIQIDQQAAESLGKNEIPKSETADQGIPIRSSSNVSLKDQLKKKSPESYNLQGKFLSDPNLNTNDGNRKSIDKIAHAVSPNKYTSNSNPNSKPTLTDSDWTALLSTPNRSKSGSGVSGTIRGKLKNARVSKGGNGALKSTQRSSIDSGKDSRVRPQKPGNVDHKNDDNEKNGVVGIVEKEKTGKNGFESMAGSANGKDDEKKIVEEGESGSSSDGVVKEVNAGSRRTGSRDLKAASSSASDDKSDSESDSGSTSGSESEREREERVRRRREILAAKAAAKAAEAIKERENLVAKLEGEKESLEKILEERAKQQVKEASELQMNMMEKMEAVELEKQKHNNTRMEALARLAKLETVNADLARTLACVQRNLEEEVTHVVELKQQIELKEVAYEELNRRMSNSQDTVTSIKQLVASKGIEFEQEILEAENSLLTNKIGQLQKKAEMLGESIETTTKEMENPTEVEIELKRRLAQLTDHLIQKQAQVENLSSEKAMLLFKIEAVSRSLEENKSMPNSYDFPSTSSRDDLELGRWEFSKSKQRFEDKLRSGKQQLGSLLQQLDSIFVLGAVFLRRNPKAKLWAMVYLVCLHFWVIYILMSRSQASDEAKSGAVISLQNINNTAFRILLPELVYVQLYAQ
ncbi:Golgin subfamily A member 5 [Dillenia turbinata]|uniref:Golgin subfamily A member 5 n=1 Tax=Dillenia turbinata TaxID=194707 RepID=A0AAN8ZRG9_9MAGN